MDRVQATVVEVDRADHGATRVVTDRLGPPAAGEVLLAVEHLALTANTVTYAVTGDSLDYWSFHPAAADGWGRVPAMGHARVVASGVDGIEVGTRTYGWYPLASHVVVAANATGGGFVDVGEHRDGHALIYRTHAATDRDPLHRDGTEHRDALLRGLFLTGYLADDALAEHHPEVVTTVVTSASAKTSIGIAQQRAERPGRLVGVTSAGNRQFVAGLGLYDDVTTYDRAGEVTTDGPAAVVDVAGNRGVLAALHRALADDLVHSMAIGRSHWNASRDVEVPDPRPVFFFAPSQAARRTEQWGAAELGRRMAAGLHRFIDHSADWLEVEHHTGTEQAVAAYQQVRAGADPRVGHVVTIPAP